MGGLGFIHLGFLAAAAAVAVPIVIHLLFRQRARRVEIGTLHFLRVVLRDQAQRRKIRRWILLALRAAAVVLLALLFARPYWNAPESRGEEQEVVLLIDRSASMAAGGAGSSPFDKAVSQAREILKGVPSGATVHIAYFDADGVVPARDGQIDPAMKPELAATDFSKALEWAKDKVVTSRRQNRRVYLLTDLQRSGLGSPLADPLPPNVDVEVMDVGRLLTKNLAVEEVQADQTDLRDGKPVIVTARVFNAGLFPVRDVSVRLSLVGTSPIVRAVSLEGQSRQVVRFEVPLSKPDLYHGFVEVDGQDDLPFDDRRWLAFDARLPDRVLLIDGEPGPSVFGNETYYLETALRLRLPGDESTTAPTPYEPVRQGWSERNGTLPELGPFRVVAVCNVPDISPSDAAILSRFVASGGSLIIFTGDRVRAGAYRALDQARILPARLEEPVEAGSYRFTEWVKDHPIFSPFADPQHGDLRTLRFRRITRVVPDSEAHILATARGGDPLVVGKAIAQGRCLLFTFPADNAWGDWAIHRLYLPMVHQVLGYLTDRLPETSRVRFEKVRAGFEQAPGVVLHSGRAVVRNVDPAESEIERTTAANLREVYRLPETRKSGSRAEIAPETLVAGGERPDELWRWVAWILLIVLVAETFVANRTYA
jgi:hypothetical protein